MSVLNSQSFFRVDLRRDFDRPMTKSQHKRVIVTSRHAILAQLTEEEINSLETVELALKQSLRLSYLQAHGVGVANAANMHLQVKMIEITRKEHPLCSDLCVKLCEELIDPNKG